MNNIITPVALAYEMQKAIEGTAFWKFAEAVLDRKYRSDWRNWQKEDPELFEEFITQAIAVTMHHRKRSSEYSEVYKAIMKYKHQNHEYEQNNRNHTEALRKS